MGSYTDSITFAQQERQRVEAEQQQRQAYEAGMREHQKDVSEIVSQGRNRYGAEAFDDAAETINNALGPEGTGNLMFILRNHDDPVGIVQKLAESGEANLKRLKNMSVERARVELARIENQLNPNGTNFTSEQPRWRCEGVTRGRISDEAFRTPISDALTDDQWSRNFEKHSRFGKDSR
jgi:hypothetical protein